MKVRLLKDWSYHKAGDVAEVFDPTAKSWISSGIAERADEPRSVVVERATPTVAAERAEMTMKRPPQRKP